MSFMKKTFKIGLASLGALIIAVLLVGVFSQPDEQSGNSEVKQLSTEENKTVVEEKIEVPIDNLDPLAMNIRAADCYGFVKAGLSMYDPKELAGFEGAKSQYEIEFAKTHPSLDFDSISFMGEMKFQAMTAAGAEQSIKNTLQGCMDLKNKIEN
jgi:hypothetical protein